MQDKNKIMGAGLRGRCPNCLEGSLFSGFLKFGKQCAACGQSYDIEDAGDGPAVFVIFVASLFIVPMALVFQMKLDPPVWLTLLIWIPIISLVCLALLRPFRGLMFAVQFMNQAEQGKFDNED